MKPNKSHATITRLKQLIKKGEPIYMVHLHTNSMGTTRRFKIFAIGSYSFAPKTKTIINITQEVAEVLGYRISKVDYGLIKNGCGMDQAFDIAYKLQVILYGVTTPENRGDYILL